MTVFYVTVDPPPPARGFGLVVETIGKATGDARAVARAVAFDHPGALIEARNCDDPTDVATEPEDT